MNGKRIYLYLVRRDKKGCQVVLILQGLETSPVKLTDIHALKLQPHVLIELQTIIHEHRMDWEPWIESVDNYEQLRQNLIRRGYSKLPLKSNPLHSESSYNDPHVADMRIIASNKVMVRKIN